MVLAGPTAGQPWTRKLAGLSFGACVDAPSVAELAKRGGPSLFWINLRDYYCCFLIVVYASIPTQYYVFVLTELPTRLRNFVYCDSISYYCISIYCTKTLAMRSIWSNANFLCFTFMFTEEVSIDTGNPSDQELNNYIIMKLSWSPQRGFKVEGDDNLFSFRGCFFIEKRKIKIIITCSKMQL